MPSGDRQSVTSFTPKTPSKTPGNSGDTVSPNSRPVTPASAMSLPVQKQQDKSSLHTLKQQPARLTVKPNSEVKSSGSSQKKSFRNIKRLAGSARGSNHPNSQASCSSHASSFSEDDIFETSEGPNVTVSIIPCSHRPLTVRSSHSKLSHSRFRRGNARSTGSSEGVAEGCTSHTVFSTTTSDTVSDSGSFRSSRISRNLPATPSLSTDTLNDGVPPTTSSTGAHRLLLSTPGCSREASFTMFNWPRPVTPSSDQDVIGSASCQQFKAPSKIPVRTGTLKSVSKPPSSTESL